MEAIQSLFDSRLIEVQKQVITQKSAQQIRGNLFMKLGIPPSPLISVGPPSRVKGQPGLYTASPSPLMKQTQVSNNKPINRLVDRNFPVRTNSTPKGQLR